MYGIPHVASAHSLEPLRPWKAEQLGGGYEVSKFCERMAIEHADAVIAVSQGMREDILACYPAADPKRVRVIYNGIDSDEYSPDPGTDVLERLGVDPRRPSVVFVGRITRQKGVEHLLEAARSFDPAAQLVLCAGAPDTPELGAEVARRVEELREQRDGVLWIAEMLPKPQVIQLLSHATVFACPSIYEPLGIVNLEAMACEAAVVATATGGIVEVVVDGETGLLVPFEPSDDGLRTPVDPQGFAAGIAAARERADRGSRPRRGDGPGGPRPGARALRLAGDRPADGGALPLALTAGRGLRRGGPGRVGQSCGPGPKVTPKRSHSPGIDAKSNSRP